MDTLAYPHTVRIETHALMGEYGAPDDGDITLIGKALCAIPGHNLVAVELKPGAVYLFPDSEITGSWYNTEHITFENETEGELDDGC